MKKPRRPNGMDEYRPPMKPRPPLESKGKTAIDSISYYNHQMINIAEIMGKLSLYNDENHYIKYDISINDNGREVDEITFTFYEDLPNANYDEEYAEYESALDKHKDDLKRWKQYQADLKEYNKYQQQLREQKQLERLKQKYEKVD